MQYRALVTVGNLHGVGGFAIGKAANPAEAITEASRCSHLYCCRYTIFNCLLQYFDVLLACCTIFLPNLDLHCAYPSSCQKSEASA